MDRKLGLTVRAAAAGLLASASLMALPSAAHAATYTISAIQGTTRISPYNGSTVTTTGIVTAIRSTGSSHGFWIQSASGDGNAATSDAIFVYTGSGTPNTAVGNSITITGRVFEYIPGGASSGNQSLTELGSASWSTDSTGNALPAAVTISDATVPATYTRTDNGGSINSFTLDPAAYALDYYESLEGMRVSVGSTPVVGPTNAYDEMWVNVKPSQVNSARGGSLYSSYSSQNSGRLQITTLLSSAFPTATVGDTISGATGVLDYSAYGGYSLNATSLGTLTSGGVGKETTAAQSPGQLSVATYNVENLDPTDPASKFTALAQGIVNNLKSPDIVALEEVQDNDGPADDGVVSASTTLSMLTSAISTAGGPAYSYTQINPRNDTDGGEPGGNIRQVLLYNSARVGFTARGNATATTANSVTSVGGVAQLTYNPGRIAPTNSAWSASRKPLAAEFTFGGQKYFVIANHFVSKGGDDALHGQYQPPARPSETQRGSQGSVENSFVDSILAAQSDAHVIVLGDLNDFPFSTAVSNLEGGVLTDLVDTLPASEQYTYVYDGNSQVLDHTLVSSSITSYDYDIVHINSEFSDQTSDHDPQVVRITP
ncbi:endonuclease/exonuclease/phosphatase family protein [Streptomyces sp. HUAS TT20]|uniref:endonuclease/exonuclease/phosphatase family protein n=1 Tax=Streptomyces sp. HUAS TT20 TaxID=3447509 RepID=UPI0021D82C52|nr:endonuclease/exonuclease/phosphatase family protein [Streptomyces sp. HUAS 15-9]UXY26840.1 endonuclease/exonuclease/phosphatase family protein [Streptomyces sp. HUAS 15-9]